MTIETKFGSARVCRNYYTISSRKEGNRNKLLHRLIWEDFYNMKVPKEYHIHHINDDKLDNRIQNLQCVKNSIHNAYHMRGNVPWNKGVKCNYLLDNKHALGNQGNTKKHYTGLNNGNAKEYITIKKSIDNNKPIYIINSCINGKQYCRKSVSKESIIDKAMYFINLEDSHYTSYKFKE